MSAASLQSTAFGQLWIDVNLGFGDNALPDLIQGIQAVQGALFNIIMTYVGTVPYFRDFGCTLIRYIFEPYDQLTADDALFAIKSAVTRWEPRVVVDTGKSAITPIPNSMFGYNIKLICALVSTNTPFSYQFKAVPIQ